MPNSKPLLLTGAGFTKNFGGFLATEMFALVQTSVRQSPMLLRMLKDSLDYEEVYGRVVIEERDGGHEERAALVASIENAYRRLDAAVRRMVWSSTGISAFHLRQFIGRFAGPNSHNPGYFFTLNQDLFIERHFGIAAGDVLLSLYGQPKAPPNLHHNVARELGSDDQVLLEGDTTHYRAAQEKSGSSFNYVKLHGSLNWRSPRIGNAMVIGHAKEGVIAREPLLAYCLEAFERELHAPGRRLCVIGYGFRDPHINQRIANALERSDLQLFAISPQSPTDFRASLCSPAGPPRGHLIWQNAVHWPWTLREIFPAGLSIPERSEWGRLVEETLFGR